MKSRYLLAFGLVIVGIAQVTACSSEFRSCTTTRTCPGGSAGIGEAGDSSDAGKGGSHAGSGGAATAGDGAAQSDAGEAGMSDGGAAGSGEPPDLCLGKVCDSPPSGDCESSTKFKAYDKIGSCSAGECSYQSHEISCTCQSHVCTTDPCVGVTCAAPPATVCKDAVTLTKYSAAGTCSVGSCSYAATDTACAFGCANGACKSDPCIGVACSTPPATKCKDANTQTKFASSGTCGSGTCSYAATDTACGSNKQCGGAGECSVCKADASCGSTCGACGAGTPKCKDLGTTSQCVGCLSNADCSGASPICDTGSSSCVARPSCVGLAATCGPNGNGDCCASGVVPGGTFFRSYDGVKFTDNSNPATVSTFRLDNYEITVGRFRKFVAAYSQSMTPQGAGKNPNNPSDTGWQTSWNAKLEPNSGTLGNVLQCTNGAGGNYMTWTAGKDNLPVNCISWYDAQAFCIWDGGRLPTEAEWNYAAAAGSEQRTYAWGNTAPGANANLAAYGCFFGGAGTCSGVGNVAPVGLITAGNGKWGQSDLAGNLEEFVQDVHSAEYLKPCVNCSNQTPDGQFGGGFNTDKSARGGTFRDYVGTLEATYRGQIGETTHSPFTGARCARAP